MNEYLLYNQGEPIFVPDDSEEYYTPQPESEYGDYEDNYEWVRELEEE